MPQTPFEQKWDAMTLYQSFSNEVLLLTPPPSNLRVPNINIDKKGPSTQAAKAPVILEKPDIRERLSRSYLPSPYVPCVLNTETDVVQASVLWLLHPVVKALQAEFPKVECAAEVEVDGCRCHALVSVGGRPMVVIEYKNRQHLKMQEFYQGRKEDRTEKNKVEINNKIAAGKKRSPPSAMGDNAVYLTKQAAAYALRWETRYVGLFDWDNLFLWNFAGLNFQQPVPGRGRSSQGRGQHADWAYGTWVRDREDYRGALLGFVMEALRDRMHPNFMRNGASDPWVPTPATKEKRRKETEAKRAQTMTPAAIANQKIYGDRRG